MTYNNSTYISKPLNTYACYSKNEELHSNSSSGGIFSVIALHILEQGGVVYGVSFTENFQSAEFMRITIKEDLPSLRCSKYFQVHVGNIYNKIQIDLKNGLQVFFCGTGCQVNGLKKFLGKNYSNLYTADIICHGVPSPALWQKYITYIESMYSRKIRNINFRCKTYKNKKFVKEDNSVYISMKENTFMKLFLKDCCLRPSCYDCKAKTYRLADLTIGDFWGIENIIADMNDGNGCSLVIIRTEKGKSLFNSIYAQLMCEEVDYEAAVQYNPSEFRSCKRPKARNTFFHDMKIESIVELDHEYADDFSSRFWRLYTDAMNTIIDILHCQKKHDNSDYGMLIEFEEKSI